MQLGKVAQMLPNDSICLLAKFNGFSWMPASFYLLWLLKKLFTRWHYKKNLLIQHLKNLKISLLTKFDGFSHQMAFSTFQPIYDLRNWPKPLSFKFRFIPCIFRTTSSAKTSNEDYPLPKRMAFICSPVAPLASLAPRPE